jgi:hypothetical protein
MNVGLISLKFSIVERLDIGMDTGSPVDFSSRSRARLRR